MRVPTFDTFRKMAFNGFGVEPAFRYHYLEKGAAKLGMQIEVRNGTADDLPVPDTSVDAVVSTVVLCCVLDQRRSIQEKVRVLKPGGKPSLSSTWPHRAEPGCVGSRIGSPQLGNAWETGAIPIVKRGSN